MKIAVISDIHENFHNLMKALEMMRENDVEYILCLGDLINPGIAQVLANCELPVFSIWGNNDGDKVMIVNLCHELDSNLKMGDKTYATLEIDGRKIFLTHYPELAKPMAESGNFDAVFYGHDHTKSQETIQDCIVINPGEISAHKTREATFVIYDTYTNQVDFLIVPDSITLRTSYVDDWFSKE